MHKDESIRRLTVLKKRLKKLKDAPIAGVGFNISSWFGATANIDPIDPELTVDPKTGTCSVKFDAPEKNVCGTRACALGHAALIPEFQAKGLKLEYVKDDYFAGDLEVSGEVFYKKVSGLEAAKKFFGIPLIFADHIFGGGNHCDDEDPQEAIDHIDNVIEAIKTGNDDIHAVAAARA